MAEWYDKTLGKIGKGLLDLDNLTNPKIVPVTSGYTFSQTHEFLDDITPAERVAAPSVLTNVTFGGSAGGGSCWGVPVACENFGMISTGEVKWSQDGNEAAASLKYPNAAAPNANDLGVYIDTVMASTFSSPIKQIVAFPNEIASQDDYGLMIVLENGELWSVSVGGFAANGVGASPTVRTLIQCVYSDDSLVDDCVKVGSCSYSQTSFFFNTSGDCYATGTDLNAWINYANSAKFVQVFTDATWEVADIAVSSGSQFNCWLAVKNRVGGAAGDLRFIGDAALGQRGDGSTTYEYNNFIAITGFAPERLKEVANGIYGIIGTAVWYAGFNQTTPYVGGGTTDNVNVGTFAQVATMDAIVEKDLSIQPEMSKTTAYDTRDTVKNHIIIDSAGGVYTPAATWNKESYTLSMISLAASYAIHANFDGTFSWEGSQDDVIEPGSTTSTGIEVIPAAWAVNVCSFSVVGAEGWLDCDDPVILSPTVDDIIAAFVVVEDLGTEATSPVLFYADEAPGLPYLVATTGAINVQLANSNGIAKL